MIEVENVTYRYAGDPQPALFDVSMRIGPGDRVGIVGPNGSGKSTFGRLVKGLLLPAEGDINVDGASTLSQGLEVRRRVGLVFQNPNSQIVNSVVEQEVAFGPENVGLPSAEIRERVSEALASVGLVGRETAECHSLSMANKQRVALAAVMAMHPRYLILDEPTAWLEPSARGILLDEVFRWADERYVGLVLVTHRMDEALLCDRLYGLLHGRVEAQGPSHEVMGNADIRNRLALAVPEGFLLASQLKLAGLPVLPGTSMNRMAEVLCPS